jgi:hypothetical protein
MKSLNGKLISQTLGAYGKKNALERLLSVHTQKVRFARGREEHSLNHIKFPMVMIPNINQ